LTGELKLGDAVHFLGTRADVAELLTALDVFVLTSRMEANPVSILEAMAAAKPVIAPRVGSISEAVIDGQTGFLTEPNSVDDVATRLVELFADSRQASQLGRQGRAAVVERWSLERMVQGYEQLIAAIYSQKCDLLGGRRRGGSDAAEPLRGASPVG
jgi:glycosyltransferase involved in cell wall biosynthesis